MNGLFFQGSIEENALAHQLKEVYLDQVYKPYLPVKKEGSLCLDIGMNVGVTAHFFSRFFDRVVGLEPAQEHFEALSRMLMFNKIDNVTAIRKALYIKEGKYPFFHPSNKTSNSLHGAVEREGNVPPEEVETITLKTLFKENDIKHVNLMKLDVEGSETEIVSHSDFKELAPQIDTILVEYHDWSGRNINQLPEALRLAGFKVTQIPHDAYLFVGTHL